MKNILKISSLCAASALALGACSLSPTGSPVSDSSYNQMEKIAINALAQFNERSFTNKVEYCGWVIELNDVVTTTETIKGEFSSCRLPDPPRGSVILASYHTHGNHTPEYASEFPSVVDVQGDFATDIHGFVSTPGGRVWVVDPFEETISQACGPGCVAVDPTYDEADYAYIPELFTKEMIYGYYGKAKGAVYKD